MRVYFDCQFVEDGTAIDLVSLALVKETGAHLYLENRELDKTKANEWIKENVLAKLKGNGTLHPKAVIRARIEQFLAVEKDLEFWTWHPGYNWVCLCQLFGLRDRLPASWPQCSYSIKQLQHLLNIKDEQLPERRVVEHHALANAVYAKECHEWLRQAATYQMAPLRYMPQFSRL